MTRGPLKVWVYGKLSIYDIWIAILQISTAQFMPHQHPPFHWHILMQQNTRPQLDLSLNLGDNPRLHKWGLAQYIPNHPSTMVQWHMVEGSMFTSSKWALAAGGKSSTVGTVQFLIRTRVADRPGMGIGDGDGKAVGAGPWATIRASCIWCLHWAHGRALSECILAMSSVLPTLDRKTCCKHHS